MIAPVQLGHDLQVAYFALAGDVDHGDHLTRTDGREVQRLPDRHDWPYLSILGISP